MSFLKNAIAGPLLCLALLAPLQASAQSAKDHPSLPTLRQWYQALLQSDGEDQQSSNKIQAERLRIRRSEIQELTKIVESSAAAADAVPEISPLAKQQELVAALESREKDTAVDLDLLEEEEDVLGREPDSAGPERTAYIRSMAEILGRRAILEERSFAIADVLSVQRDRLQRLTAQEVSERFGNLIQAGFYAGIVLLVIFSERVVRRLVFSRVADRNRRYRLTKVFTGIVYLILIAWILYRLSADYPGIVTSFAIIGAGVAVALQSVIKDVVGWIIIVQKRLFTLGQRVAIGPYSGDVADISLLRTTIVEVLNTESNDISRSGQTLHLPNSLVLDRPVLNYHATSDFMEAEISFVLPYGGDWQQAETILRQILHDEVGQFVERARLQHLLRTAHFFATQEPPEPRVFMDLGADGVLFTLRFLIPIGRRRSVVTSITRKILERFAQAEPPIPLTRQAIAVLTKGK